MINSRRTSPAGAAREGAGGAVLRPPGRLCWGTAPLDDPGGT